MKGYNLPVQVRMKGRVMFDALLDDVDFPQKK